jgi:hypothetical protein
MRISLRRGSARIRIVESGHLGRRTAATEESRPGIVEPLISRISAEPRGTPGSLAPIVRLPLTGDMIMRSHYTIIIIAIILFVAGSQDARAGDEGSGWVNAMAHISGMNGETVGYCDGVIMFEKYTPRVVFGLNKRPNDKGRYTYFLLLKERPKERAGLEFKMEGRWSSLGHEADGTTRLTLSGKPIEYSYHFKADETTQALLEETVKIGGKVLAKGDPRVYLVDLTRDKVICQPVLVDLPGEVPDLSDREKKTWGPAVRRTIEQLKEKSAEVRQFLAPGPGE